MKAKPKKGSAGRDCSCIRCWKPIKIGQDAYAASWCSPLYCSAKCYRTERKELIQRYGNYAVAK